MAMKILLFILLSLFFNILFCISGNAQVGNSDTINCKKIFTKENFPSIINQKINNTPKETVKPVVKNDVSTSGLDAYERLLKYYQDKTTEAKEQGLSTEEYDNKITQLKKKIEYERNIKNYKYSDPPEYIDTGNFKEDQKIYEKTKLEWIENHKEEYYIMQQKNKNKTDKKINK